MEYKVSYNEFYGKDGTHYTQRVRVQMTTEQLMLMNTEFSEKRHADPHRWLYLKPVEGGDNETTLTTSLEVARHIGADKDKRFKKNRNTIVRIDITDLTETANAVTFDGDVCRLQKTGGIYICGDVPLFRELADRYGRIPVWLHYETDTQNTFMWFEVRYLFEFGRAAAKDNIQTIVLK